MPTARSKDPREAIPREYLLFWGLALLAVYGIVFFAPFLYDDEAFLLKNPLVTGSWPGLKAFLTSSFAGEGEYGPLITLGHWLLYHLGGEQVFLYRLTSLALHAANSLLCWRLFRRLLGSPGPAFAAAVLFSLYPAHAEVLALSSFKKHLAVAFFGLVLLNIQAEQALPRTWRWGLGWAALVLALLCKESALVLPVLAVLAAGVMERGLRREERLFYGGLFLISIIYAALRLVVVPRTLAPLAGGGWGLHLLTCGKIALWYLGQLAWPSGLCLEHSLSAVSSAGEGLLVVLGAAAAAAAGFWLYRFDRFAWLGFAWCLLCLAPFLNVVPYLNYSLVANRYLYLPSAGFFLAAAGVWVRLDLSKRLRPGVAAVAVVLAAGGYGIEGARHMGRFTDRWALWSQAVKCAPGNARVHVYMAYVYLERMMYYESIAEFETGFSLDPRMRPVFYNDLGLAYAESGKVEKALLVTEAEVRHHPRPDAWNNVGIFYLRLKQPLKARQALERAARLDPESGETLLNLGACDLALGRRDQAQREFERGAQDPSVRPKALRMLGDLYLKRGNPRRARRSFEDSLALDPMQWETTSQLARLYLSSGQRDKAVDLLQGFIDHLEQARDFLRGDARAEDRAKLAYLEGLYARVRRERDGLLR